MVKELKESGPDLVKDSEVECNPSKAQCLLCDTIFTANHLTDLLKTKIIIKMCKEFILFSQKLF